MGIPHDKDICTRIVQPKTKKAGTAYFKLPLESVTSADTQLATHFVSHAWKYKFSDVIEALVTYGEANPGAFFWFDLFMNDQNNAAALPQEWWSTTFKTAIGTIGHTLLIFSPWDDPIPMTRAWCLFEMNHTIDSETCKMDVLLPAKERQGLKEAVIKSADAAQKVLRDVDAERAEAFKKEDKDMIFETIRKNAGGFHGLNTKIKAGMRVRILELVQEFVTEEEVGEDASDEKRIEYANVCFKVGKVMSDNGEHDKALFYYEKALKIQEQALGTNHPIIATSYNNIGGVYSNKGDYDKALENYRKALKIQEQALGTNHPDTATSYNNIGGVYDEKGDHDKALENYRKALRIREQALGTNHPNTATSYNNIGAVYDDKGDVDRALENHRKALKIREQALGTNHPDTATSYNNIGAVYDDKGDVDRALENYRKALKIREQALGTNHPSIATSYNNIGLVYEKKGDYDRALENHRKALKIKEQALGTNHPSTATSYNNIGLVYSERGDYDNALNFFERAETIFVESLGTTHPNTVSVRESIAAVKSKMN